uniref:Uncharacterized protein n=1 Tax=Salmo trutta TaxID=8032 RepID=A0A674CYU5_SALTR
MFPYQGNEIKSKSQSQSVHSEDHLVILMDLPPAERDCSVDDDASLNCAVTVSNGQEEMSPELQCCVEWLWAYFSELWTVGSHLQQGTREPSQKTVRVLSSNSCDFIV